MRTSPLFILALSLALGSSQALAAPTLESPFDELANGNANANVNAQAIFRNCQCRPVEEQVLARLRGGFDDGRGLIATIGLERLTMVNGTVVSTVNLHIGDLSKASAQQLQQLQSALGAVGIVNGAGNSLGTLMQTAPAGTTVIQNSLNNQVIRNTTVLSIGTNSQQLVKAMNLQSALQDALNLPLSAR